ncbi:hypothetical protein ABB37_05847 [Leptomonas pyrrhocoris]|uniref:Uncharacterized protein n=1 Tax=Leptomonas pyrrhocoris TaxID=157538 RepID=A0A0N0DUC1_LEPPY|nr:hypothetical protein ABB37_05847 [Leptomonas pyrrhocoris]XP_015657157.1 hypothetical protein ABB37_05847 [Leptomonas pyrrhocoris]KPA78717.1 hypothetical protein ABB37_05847 [Leptomonas pyrrhocoris]KPA78718.1 hypothetical protein ABB37_05847 [Leptomonas pyrrhocoris]|eukprot:XP_015657156.1 hypothetical protein ABB37_05847 [Leptomonas pyrrhocoris]
MGGSVACCTGAKAQESRSWAEPIALSNDGASHLPVQHPPAERKDDFAPHGAASGSAAGPPPTGIPSREQKTPVARRSIRAVGRSNDGSGARPPIRSRVLLRRIQHGVDISGLEIEGVWPVTCEDKSRGEAEPGRCETKSSAPKNLHFHTEDTAAVVRTVSDESAAESPGPLPLKSTLDHDVHDSGRLRNVSTADAAVSGAHAKRHAVHAPCPRGVVSPVDNTHEDVLTPLHLDFEDIACSPDATPAEGAVDAAKRTSRRAVSTTPHLFAPLRGGGGDGETAFSHREESCDTASRSALERKLDSTENDTAGNTREEGETST